MLSRSSPGYHTETGRMTAHPRDGCSTSRVTNRSARHLTEQHVKRTKNYWPMISQEIAKSIDVFCSSLATSKDDREIKRLLGLGVDAYIHEKYIHADAPVDFKPYMPPRNQSTILADRSLRALFYEESGGFQKVSDALLSTVIVDRIKAFSDEEKHSLIFIWYDEAPALPLLQALISHLASVQPWQAKSGSTRVQVAAADVATAILIKHFANSVEKMHELSLLQNQAQRDVALTLLSSIPDREFGGDFACLLPYRFIPFVLKTCINMNFPSSFLSEMMLKFSRRGHARVVAMTLIDTLCSEEGIGDLQSQIITESIVEANDLMSIGSILFWLFTECSMLEKGCIAVEVLSKAIPASLLSTRADLMHYVCNKWLLQMLLPSRRALKLLLDYVATINLRSIVEMVFKEWSDKATIQKLPVRQQAYLTDVVLGLLEKMTKEQVESWGAVLPCLLEGIGMHLESPLVTLRNQGMRVGNCLSSILGQERVLFEDVAEGMPEDIWWQTCADTNPSIGQYQTSEKEVVSKVETCSTEPLTETDSDDEQLYEILESDSDEDFELPGIQLRDLPKMLSKGDGEWKEQLKALKALEPLVRAAPDELPLHAAPLCRALLHAKVPVWMNEELQRGDEDIEGIRLRSVVAVLTTLPEEGGIAVATEFYSPSLDMHQRLLALNSLSTAAKELSQPGSYLHPLKLSLDDKKKVRGRTLDGDLRVGRVTWMAEHSLKRLEQSAGAPMTVNRFPHVALKWTAALLKECDVQGHGIDLFNRDAFLLGRLLVTLGTFLECSSNSHVSPALAAATIELIRSPQVHQNCESYVRRAAMLAAAQSLCALSPAVLASSLLPMSNASNDLQERLQWLQNWISSSEEDDLDETCRKLATSLKGLQGGLIAGALTTRAESIRLEPPSIEISKPLALENLKFR